MDRQNIVAGNWKMNLNIGEGETLVREILKGAEGTIPQLILCPPYIHLLPLAELLSGKRGIALGGQNCYQKESGAYTGEISAAMLKSVGAEYVILGHSERREYFGETDELLAEKVNLALAAGLVPIFCCGETLDVRKKNAQNELISSQISTALFHLGKDDFSKIVIAYEPVWAIGTGETASPEQAQDVHKHIRGVIAKQYGAETANATSILYGGSVKPGNAKELFGQEDVDGGLIGGASLKAADFLAIAESFTPV